MDRSLWLWIYCCSFALAVSSSVRSCPTLSTVDHGYVCDNDTSNPSRIVFYFCCDDKFYLRGNRNISCIDNQTWSGSEPQCINNGIDIAYDIIIVLSVVGVLVLLCIIAFFATLGILCIRRRKRIKRIDRYLNVLRDNEKSFEDSDTHSNYYMQCDIEKEERTTVTNRSYNTPMAMNWHPKPTHSKDSTTEKMLHSSTDLDATMTVSQEED